MHNPFTFFKPDPTTKYQLPATSSSVQAGFPSAGENHIEQTLDLNKHLIKHPAATFFVRVNGDSMSGIGINQDDTLIVDRAIEPSNDSIVVAIIDNEFTLKRIKITNGSILLVAENPNYKPIVITKENDFSIWGTVTHVIHSF